MIQLNYETYGEDNKGLPPIVVIHGWATSLELMRDFSVSLSAYSKVYSIDLPGHGKSDSPDGVWGMKDFAECLKNFLDSKGIKKAIFVGHSFGGKTLIKFSSLYSSYIDKLILICSSGIRPAPSLKKRIRNAFIRYLRNFIRFKNTKIGNKIYQNWYIPKFASRDYLAAGKIRQTFVKTINEDLYDELRAVNSKCLLIWGEEDDETPLIVANTMNELISDSELKIIPKVGHYPFLGSTKHLVTAYIRDFIS